MELVVETPRLRKISTMANALPRLALFLASGDLVIPVKRAG
jgi:hypothetical protein